MTNWQTVTINNKPGYIHAEIDGVVYTFDSNEDGVLQLIEELGVDARECYAPYGQKYQFDFLTIYLNSFSIKRVRNLHPYGSDVAVERWTDVEVDADIIIPFGKGLEDLKNIERRVILDVGIGKIKPDFDTLTFFDCTKDGVAACCDWSLA